MSQATFTAQTAINESKAEDRIVTLEFANGGKTFTAVLDELSALSEGDTSYAGPDEDGTYIYEYWGKSEEGDDWRVLVKGPRTV